MPATAAPPTSRPRPTPLRVLRDGRAEVEERRRAAERYMAAVERELEMARAWIAMTSRAGG